MPAWVACIVQRPPEFGVRLVPATEQTAGVRLVSTTGRPEVAVALTAIGAALKGTVGRAKKLMLCEAGLTVKLCVTAGAAAKLALPDWLAWTEQTPPAAMVKRLPETVQTAEVEVAKTTGRLEVAVAIRAMGAVPNVTF